MLCLLTSLHEKTFLSRRDLPTDGWIGSRLELCLGSWQHVPVRISSPVGPILTFCRSVLASIIVAKLASIVVAGLAAIRLAAGTAVRSINSLVSNPPSPVYALLVTACLLPILDFCAPAAWKRLECVGLVSPMATPARVGSSQVAVAAEQDMLIFPTKEGGTEQRTL
jgi:hypothetical protein